MDALTILKILAMALLCGIMIIFIIIEVKSIYFLKDLNKTLDEITGYLKSLNWVFSTIDFITEKLLSVREKTSYIFSQIWNILFKK